MLALTECLAEDLELGLARRVIGECQAVLLNEAAGVGFEIQQLGLQSAGLVQV